MGHGQQAGWFPQGIKVFQNSILPAKGSEVQISSPQIRASVRRLLIPRLMPEPLDWRYLLGRLELLSIGIRIAIATATLKGSQKVYRVTCTFLAHTYIALLGELLERLQWGSGAIRWDLYRICGTLQSHCNWEGARGLTCSHGDAEPSVIFLVQVWPSAKSD